MRKIVGIFSLILGLAIICTGIFMQIDLNKPKEEKENDIFETKTFKVKRMNKFNIEETCKTYSKIDSYINTVDYTKISFTYPNCVHEYDFTALYKTLKSEDGKISISIRKENENMTKYIKSMQTELAANNYNDIYSESEYSQIFTDKTDSGLEVNLIESNYIYGYAKTPYDVWYIAVDLKNDMILTFEIEVQNNIMSIEAIRELYKSIKVEEKKAEFLNTKTEGKYQVGTLKQNKKGFHDKGYKANLKVSTKYPEVATTSSNLSNSIFEIESVYEKVYAWISLEKESYNKTFEEKMTDEKKYSIQSYYENPLRYRNLQDSGIIKKTINGKEVRYYVFSYDYYLEDAKEKSDTQYLSEIFYEIEPGFYYKIYLNTKNILINEALISDFLNFTVEEY